MVAYIDEILIEMYQIESSLIDIQNSIYLLETNIMCNESLDLSIINEAKQSLYKRLKENIQRFIQAIKRIVSDFFTSKQTKELEAKTKSLIEENERLMADINNSNGESNRIDKATVYPYWNSKVLLKTLTIPDFRDNDEEFLKSLDDNGKEFVKKYLSNYIQDEKLSNRDNFLISFRGEKKETVDINLKILKFIGEFLLKNKTISNDIKKNHDKILKVAEDAEKELDQIDLKESSITVLGDNFNSINIDDKLYICEKILENNIMNYFEDDDEKEMLMDNLRYNDYKSLEESIKKLDINPIIQHRMSRNISLLQETIKEYNSFSLSLLLEAEEDKQDTEDEKDLKTSQEQETKDDEKPNQDEKDLKGTGNDTQKNINKMYDRRMTYIKIAESLVTAKMSCFDGAVNLVNTILPFKSNKEKNNDEKRD